MSKYIYIADQQELFAANKRGEKIEHTSNGGTWEPWSGMAWSEIWQFRIVKPDPRMQEVKLFAWLTEAGCLVHVRDKEIPYPKWRRVLGDDKTVMVEVKE